MMINLHPISEYLQRVRVLTRPTQVFAKFVLVMALSTAHASGQHSNLCEEFRRNLSMPNEQGMSKYLQACPNVGNSSPCSLDLDHDGSNDELTMSCPSDYIEPSDPCMLIIELASGKTFEFKFEFNDFPYLIRRKSTVYAITERFDSKDKRTGNRKVYRISGSGVHLICTNL